MMRGFTLIELIVVMIIIGLLAAIVVPAIPGASCHARWDKSGMLVQYGVVSGCRLSSDGGQTWIPEDRYRTMQ